MVASGFEFELSIRKFVPSFTQPVAETKPDQGFYDNRNPISGITERDVRKPKVEHPKRPVTGFDCTRSEVSGERFWGFFKEECQGDPGRAKVQEMGFIEITTVLC